MGVKGRNFSEEEDMQLCRSYLAIGKDARVGTYQTSSTFWERITKHFQDACPQGADEHSYRSLECKWGEISRAVSKFCGSFANVMAFAKSDANEDDEIQRACELYKQTSTGKKLFKFLHCWRILRGEPKWHDFRPKAMANATAATATAPVFSQDCSSSRPQGIKAVKAAAKAEAIEESNRKRLADATETLTAASVKRVRALEYANRVALFAMPLETLDDDAQEFFGMLRAEALDGMRQQAASRRSAAERARDSMPRRGEGRVRATLPDEVGGNGDVDGTSVDGDGTAESASEENGFMDE